MDPELKRLLEDTHALVKDNHRMLRAVRRHQIFSAFGKVIVWIVVILATALSYEAYVKPLIDTLHIPGLSAIESGALDTSTTTPLGKLINYFKAGK